MSRSPLDKDAPTFFCLQYVPPGTGTNLRISDSLLATHPRTTCSTCLPWCLSELYVITSSSGSERPTVSLLQEAYSSAACAATLASNVSARVCLARFMLYHSMT